VSELYTVRAKIRPVPSISRGNGVVETTHHFEGISDESAALMLPTLSEKWTDDQMQGYWWCTRAGLPVHELSLYRRDITDATVWTWIADHTFALPNLAALSGTIDIHNVPFSYNGRYEPWYPHRRGAILCEQVGVDPRHRRRVYVGPVSNYFERIEVSIPLADPVILIGARSDIPTPLPTEADSVDYWQDDIAAYAAQWLGDMDDELASLVQVVPSFKLGGWSTLTQTRASTVRAEVRSRGVRGSWVGSYP